MRAEKIATDIADAREILSGPTSPVPQLASLLRRLQRKAADVPGLLDEIIKGVDGGLISLDAAQSAVEAAMRACEFDPQLLESTEERLFSLRAASRKFAVPVDDLAQLRDFMHADLAELDAGEERLRALEKQGALARDLYDGEALRLSEARVAAAAALTRAVMAELPALKLERAEFIVELTSEPDNRAQEGIDQVEFWVLDQSRHAGGAADEDRVGRRVVAFPAGAQGRARRSRLGADARVRRNRHGVAVRSPMPSAQRLARLSQRVQVLSVTHAPQVAARAPPTT